MQPLAPLSLRRTLLGIAHKSKASHIGTCLSCIEILSAVFQSVDISKIASQEADRDRIILSKGHAAAALYTTLHHCGLISEAEFNTYYSAGSLLSGHSNHFHPMVEHSTGALGHGLSAGVGMAMGLKARKLKSRVFVILGDGELNEGSNYEAFMLAGHLKLDNLCVLIDNNKLSGIGLTDSFCSLEPLADKLEAFNFHTIRQDGHQLQQLFDNIQTTAFANKPVAIICDTVKGKGVPFMEAQNAWHYRPLNDESYAKALAELY
ncbi:transketolase [Rheinheimera texasensis]|uniref:transketolase n=1 Tax=Rheinheimera texasensis TaxID=306205 RepID=UPI0004E13207|nr:transketolase [Rheinheimera texasensis]